MRRRSFILAGGAVVILLAAAAAAGVVWLGPSPKTWGQHVQNKFSTTSTSTSETANSLTTGPARAGLPNSINLDSAAEEALLGAPAAASEAGALIAPAEDIIWGVNGHPLSAYPDISMAAQLDLLAKLGLKQYRVNMGSADDLERLLPLAEARGITILPILFPEGSFEADSAETIYDRSRKAAETMARRFAGRIPVWELGNELENYAIIQPCEIRDDDTQYPCDWGPAGGVGPLEYYGPRWKKVSAALHGLSDGVHAGDPAALRAVGTAGWGHTGAFDRMKQDGIEWDISVWHQYQTAEQIDWAMQKVAAFGKPIWITEFYYLGGSTDSEAVQAQGLASMMAGHRANRAKYRIGAVFIYELLDEPYWTDFEGKMGLVHVEKNAAGRWVLGSNKPAAEVVRSIIAAGP